MTITKTKTYSFLKIATFGSTLFGDLNSRHPHYQDNSVEVISITPCGTDKEGNPLFCFELL